MFGIFGNYLDFQKMIQIVGTLYTFFGIFENILIVPKK